MESSTLGFAVGCLSLVASAQVQGITLPERTTGLAPIEGLIW